jgi:DNA polymerase-3 subunit gamma/tau
VSLEQVISFSGTDVQDEDVSALLGVIKLDFYRNYFKGIITGDVQSVVGLTGEIMNSGYEIDDFIQGLQEYARNLIVLKDGQARVSDANLSLVDLPVEDVKKLKEETACFSEEELVWMVDAISQAQKDLHNFWMGGQERLILELMAIRLAKHGVKKQAGAASKSPEARQAAKDPVPSPAPVPHPAPHPAPQEQDKPKVVPDAVPKVEQAQPASRSDNENSRPPAGPALKEKSAPRYGEINLEAVLEGWGRFVQIIKEIKPGMAHFLEEARPKELKEGTLTVSFNKELEFQRKRAEEKEDKSYIELTLKEVYGMPLKIKYLPGDHAQEEKIKKAEEEPLLKKTLEIFKAKIVDRKKIL